MTYSPAAAEQYHTLIKIELTGLTLYFADENLSMSDGNFYEGRLRLTGLTRSFSSYSEPKQRQSTMTVRLRDEDATIRGYLEDYHWGNKAVTIYVGKGRDLSDYTVEFQGQTKFPGGVSFDYSQVEIQVRDARNKDWTMLPENKFWTSDYPNLEEGLSALPIPYVWGDWSDTPVPCYCIDTTTNKFKIADHSIESIVQVYKNGATISHADEDLSNAEFTITSYTPEDDTVTATITGRDEGGSLLENAIDILEDIQVNMVGIAAGDLDSSSYNELRAALSDMVLRYHLKKELSSNTIIEELMLEVYADLFLKGDTYYVTDRIPSSSYDYLFDESNTREYSFQVQHDPENLYANRIKVEYKYDPVEERYLKNVQADNTEEQTAAGKIMPITSYLDWLYTDADGTTFSQHRRLLYSQEIRVIEFDGLQEAIIIGLGDRVGLTLFGFDERPLLVRKITKNFEKKSAKIEGYDVLSWTNVGHWTADTAPDYSTATDAEKTVSGYWCDASGLADPGNPDSDISQWW